MAYDAVTAPISAKPATTTLVRRLSQNTGLMTWLSDAIAPFSLKFENSGSGSDLVGDRPAMLFLEHFAERIAPFADQHGAFLDANAIKVHLQETLEEVLKHDLALRLEGVFQPVKPHSMVQLAFVYDLPNADLPLVFGLGPTGTGKTFLAVAAALNQLERGNVKRIIITKPHEKLAGEQMTATKRAEKERDEQFEVYFDILNELIGQETINTMLERRQLEVTPLGLLRGRTLTDAYILIDEAQNIDKHWMRLAVTRAGHKSRTIVTGDPAQSALASGEQSGLTHLLNMIRGHQIGRLHTFKPKDIVRNDTVAQLEALYAEAGEHDLDLSLQRD